MDLAPSAYRTLDAGPQAQRKRDAASRNRANQAGHAAYPSGAVRRSSEPGTTTDSGHLGKLTAAIVIAGGVVWTASSSEPLAQSQNTTQATLKASVAVPSFFFDDRADALERSHGQALPDTALLSIPAERAGTDQAVRSEQTSLAATMASNPQSSPAQIVFEPPQQPAATDNSSESGFIISAPDTDKTSSISATAVNEPDEVTAPAVDRTRQITVSPGDTMSGILSQNGLKGEEFHQVMLHEVVKTHLSNIDINQTLELELDEDGLFQSLTTRAGSDIRVNIERSANGFDIAAVDLPIERTIAVSSGRIDQSLYLAAERASLRQSTIMELANIFQWELDFARDIRQGDKFSLVYEKLFREDQYIGDGDILAAEFVRGGKSYVAIRFTTEDGESGYYTPDGNSKRRTFMRHPVDVVRITSKFDPNRLHPVLHKIRAHRGVDYGSPHGSPIYATADGKVAFSGSKNAYGNTVILKHGDKFSTLYAHMSRISDKSKVGSRIKQGDVIGYVGKTGRVTGTHLHYEFRVNGKQIDPLKVELPAAEPLAKRYHAQLKQTAVEMSILMAPALADVDNQVASAPDAGTLIPVGK